MEVDQTISSKHKLVKRRSHKLSSLVMVYMQVLESLKDPSDREGILSLRTDRMEVTSSSLTVLSMDSGSQLLDVLLTLWKATFTPSVLHGNP